MSQVNMARLKGNAQSIFAHIRSYAGMIKQVDPNNALIDELVATATSSLAEIEGNLIYTVDAVTFRTRIIPVCRDRYMTIKQCLEIMKAYPVPDRVYFSFM